MCLLQTGKHSQHFLLGNSQKGGKITKMEKQLHPQQTALVWFCFYHLTS